MAQDNQDDSQENQPKYLTHEDLNGALAAQKKEFQKLMQQMQQQNQTLVETLQKTLGPKPEAAPLPSKQELSDDTAELKKQIRILMERDQQREQSEKSMRKEKTLRDALAKHGINSRSDLAISHLKDQVSWDEEGQLVMKFDEISYPLADAVAKFAQTDHGKFLADPKDVRGSGSSSTRSPNMKTQSFTNQSSTVDASGNVVFKDRKALMDYAVAKIGKSDIKI
jgi:hypothetical protein